MVFLEPVPLPGLPPMVPAFWTHSEPEKEFVLPEGTSQWPRAAADTAAGRPRKAAGSRGHRTSVGPSPPPPAGKA